MESTPAGHTRCGCVARGDERALMSLCRCCLLPSCGALPSKSPIPKVQLQQRESDRENCKTRVRVQPIASHRRSKRKSRPRVRLLQRHCTSKRKTRPRARLQQRHPGSGQAQVLQATGSSTLRALPTRASAERDRLVTQHAQTPRQDQGGVRLPLQADAPARPRLWRDCRCAQPHRRVQACERCLRICICVRATGRVPASETHPYG
jgi:hypothetical protein